MSDTRDQARSSTPSPARNLEQRRAADALRAVQKLRADRTLPEDKQEKLLQRYHGYVDRLGPAILMNGLGQALATELSAAGEVPDKREKMAPDRFAHLRLYENLRDWLCGDGKIYPPGDLLEAIVKHGESKYLRAQLEALGWLEWHKKFCRAYLPADKQSD
ncbi:MAG: type III-B CRISPR module-associated protein Cmr5 [Candidatus Binataceae bacterium]